MAKVLPEKKRRIKSMIDTAIIFIEVLREPTISFCSPFQSYSPPAGEAGTRLTERLLVGIVISNSPL